MEDRSGNTSAYSQLPSVDALIQSVDHVDLPHVLKRDAARELLNKTRKDLSRQKKLNHQKLLADYEQRCMQIAQPLRSVINASGIVIHTNLGRAPLGDQLLESLELIRNGYTNLEMDLSQGKRGDRHDHLRPWIRGISSAEDGLLVNNNAAAVLLALNTLANRKEVIISRGQMVEIGGSFRIPEILKKAGSKLVEIGTTNRTHLEDYERAITPRTKLLLWVHSSNYKITGFTKEVELSALVSLGRKYSIPVMADLGSGALLPIDQFGLQREPLISEVIQSGVDLATFSVDKLLGGPQGGIIVGKAALIRKIQKNNLLRALRPDKVQILLTLAALRANLASAEQLPDLPVYADFSRSLDALQNRAHQIIKAITNRSLKLIPIETEAQVGSGASPAETMLSVGIEIHHPAFKPSDLAKRLRSGKISILGRITDNRLILDLKAVRQSQDAEIIRALNELG